MASSAPDKGRSLEEGPIRGIKMATEEDSHIEHAVGQSDPRSSERGVPNDAQSPSFAVPKRLSGKMAPPSRREPSTVEAQKKPIVEKTDAEKDAAFARSLAVSAGAKASQFAAPGQMERAISQAAAAAASAYAMTKGMTKPDVDVNGSDKIEGRPAERSMPGYKEPEWGAPPKADFFLEIMKSGQIIEKEPLRGKSHFTIGKIPTCDLVQQHPSISRLHAILQFQGDKAGPQLFDTGSLHGSFVNKKQIKPKTYVPLRVGDMMRFGQSSRMFILGGPPEFMPEEGLSREERHRLAAMEAKEKRKDREKAIAQAQMAMALNKGINWGMDQDAMEEVEEGGTPTVDWRAYSSTHSLTEKQQKLSDKIRRLENRIRNLTTESEKIRAKQSSMEELSAGQAQTLARNEQVIDQSTDDLEDLEEQINNSIAESLKGKKNKLEADNLKTEKRKRSGLEEAKDKSGSESEEDDFYDRTALHKRKKHGSNKVDAQDPSSIFGRKAALLEEAEKLRKDIKEEESSNVNENMPEDTSSQVSADPLDAFMSNVEIQIEHGKVDRLRKQLSNLETEIKSLEILLAKADPDGYFKEGTHAARVAKERGIRLYNQDKHLKSALEKKKRQDAAARAEQEAQAQKFIPEEEPPDIPHSDQNLDTDASRNQVVESQKEEKSDLPEQLDDSAQIKALRKENDGTEEDIQRSSKQVPRLKTSDDSAQLLKPSIEEIGGLEIRKKPDKKSAAFAPSQYSLPTQEQEVSDSQANQASVSANMKEDEDRKEKDNEAKFVWVAPKGQTGDGRTALNDKFGY